MKFDFLRKLFNRDREEGPAMAAEEEDGPMMTAKEMAALEQAKAKLDGCEAPQITSLPDAQTAKMLGSEVPKLTSLSQPKPR